MKIKESEKINTCQRVEKVAWYEILYIQGVSIYMGPMWLLITSLIIILSSFFVSDLKIVYYNNY